MIAKFPRLEEATLESQSQPWEEKPPAATVDPDSAQQFYKSRLPVSLSELVGRGDELLEIRQLLQAGRLVTLTGPGGIGKTRLALDVGWQNLPYFEDGVFFMPLFSASSPEALLSNIAETLGFSFSAERDAKAQLLDFLRAKRAFLILDSFEHALAASGLLVDILQTARGVQILVTSREGLGVQGEWAYPLACLSVPEAGDVLDLKSYGAVQLFIQAAQRVHVNFSVNRFERERAHIARICRLVEGLPLAIELAAAWTRAASCEAIATEIEKDIAFLKSNRHDFPERHSSLEIVFEHSWELLTAEEKNAFCGLSLLSASFSQEAAQVIAGASLETLIGLVDKSFVRWEPRLARYEIHDFLRQFATKKLPEVADRELAVRERFFGYYLGLLARSGRELQKSGQAEAQQEISLEIGNIHGAWRRALADEKFAWIEQSLDGLFEVYRLRNWLLEGENTLAAAAQILNAASASRDWERLGRRLLARQGAFTYRLGRYDAAREMLQRALEAFQAWGDEKECAFCLFYLADLALQQSRYDEAQNFFGQSLALARSMQSQRLEADCLANLGAIALHRGDSTEFVRCSQQALVIYRQTGNWLGQGNILANLGAMYRNRGQRDEALSCLAQAQQIYTQTQNLLGKASVLNTFAGIQGDAGDLAGAMSNTQEVLAIYRQFGDRRREAIALHNLGTTFQNQGIYEQAIASYDQALRLSQELGTRQLEAATLDNLGLVSMNLGNYTQAKNYLEQALRACQAIGQRVGECMAWNDLGILYFHMGDAPQSYECAQKAIALSRELNNPLLQGHASNVASYSLSAMARWPEAIETLKNALKIFRAIGDEHLAFESQAGLAYVYLCAGKRHLAKVSLQEIVEKAEPAFMTGFGRLAYLCLCCYKVLRALQDERAPLVLEKGYLALQERAAAISSDALRRSFWENVPTHAELAKEYQRLHPAAPHPGETGVADLPDPLSGRELDVLHWIAAGYSNQEIADGLCLSLNTVKTHIKSIFGKLEVRSRVQAVKRGRELKLVERVYR